MDLFHYITIAGVVFLSAGGFLALRLALKEVRGLALTAREVPLPTPAEPLITPPELVQRMEVLELRMESVHDEVRSKLARISGLAGRMKRDQVDEFEPDELSEEEAEQARAALAASAHQMPPTETANNGQTRMVIGE